VFSAADGAALVGAAGKTAEAAMNLQKENADKAVAVGSRAAAGLPDKHTPVRGHFPEKGSGCEDAVVVVQELAAATNGEATPPHPLDDQAFLCLPGGQGQAVGDRVDGGPDVDRMGIPPR